MEAQLSRLDIIRAALAEASPHKATLAEATPHGSAPSSQALWDATGGISAPVIAENEIVAPVQPLEEQMHDSSGSSQSESKISGWDSDSQIPKWGPEAQGSQPNPSLSAISEDSWIAIAQQALAHAACVSVSGDDGEWTKLSLRESFTEWFQERWEGLTRAPEGSPAFVDLYKAAPPSINAKNILTPFPGKVALVLKQAHTRSPTQAGCLVSLAFGCPLSKVVIGGCIFGLELRKNMLWITMGENMREVCKVRVTRPTVDFRKIDEDGIVHCSYKLGDWILVTGYVELSHQVGHTQRMIASHDLPVCISEESAKHHIDFAERFVGEASVFMAQARMQALTLVFNTLFADSPAFLDHILSSELPVTDAIIVSRVARILIDCIKKGWRRNPYCMSNMTYWCRETAPMLFERGWLCPSLISNAISVLLMIGCIGEIWYDNCACWWYRGEEVPETMEQFKDAI